jgi:hypothetical protein
MVPAVFAVFAGNYQRQTIPTPQKCSIAGGVVQEKTAGTAATCTLVRSLAKMKRFGVACWVRLRETKEAGDDVELLLQK